MCLSWGTLVKVEEPGSDTQVPPCPQVILEHRLLTSSSTEHSPHGFPTNNSPHTLAKAPEEPTKLHGDKCKGDGRRLQDSPSHRPHIPEGHAKTWNIIAASLCHGKSHSVPARAQPSHSKVHGKGGGGDNLSRGREKFRKTGFAELSS